jgi:hypothetical protein
VQAKTPGTADDTAIHHGRCHVLRFRGLTTNLASEENVNIGNKSSRYYVEIDLKVTQHDHKSALTRSAGFKDMRFDGGNSGEPLCFQI